MAETGRDRYTPEESAEMSAAPSRGRFEALLAAAASAGNSILSVVTGLLAAFLILYSGYVLYDTFYTQNQAFANSAELMQYRPEYLTELEDMPTPLAGGGNLAEVTQDYRAWLTAYDTRIDYPVMQGLDDVYYAAHDVFGNGSITGAIYMAAANSPDFSDNYNIVYGHHMDNGAMFGGLDSYRDEGYFNSHREGILATSQTIYDLNVFAVLDTDAYESMVYTIGNRNLEEVLGYIGQNARVADMAAAEGAQRIVGLSTCGSTTGTERLVVFAVMTPRSLEISATGYTGVYDGAEHTLQVSTGYPAGTVLRYSIDGGQTFTDQPPVIRNVGEIRVLIEAENSLYGADSVEVILRVTPAPLTITVNDAAKMFGEADPVFSAVALGLIPSDGIASMDPYITLGRTGADEAAGTYEDVLTATLNEAWLSSPYAANYAVTIVPGTFTISPLPVLTLTAFGYSGVYDALSHTVTVNTDLLPAGTLIEYSIDGGVTWSTNPPYITDVGQIQVAVRATLPGYTSATVNVLLEVTPAPVTVRANDASKEAGTPDPDFGAVVTGVVDGFNIEYTIGRLGNEETAGVYNGEIVPSGEAVQGNYIVTYVPGTLTITEPEIEVIVDPTVPMAAFIPEGNRYGDRAWALVNLICLIITVYLFLPLLHLKDKFGRAKMMKKVNEAKAANVAENANEEPYYLVKKFLRRFRVGLVLELIISIGAIVAFILTEDMRLPMILIDKWTPLMILLMAACWGTDVGLIRYRNKVQEEEEQEEVQKS